MNLNKLAGINYELKKSLPQNLALAKNTFINTPNLDRPETRSKLRNQVIEALSQAEQTDEIENSVKVLCDFLDTLILFNPDQNNELDLINSLDPAIKALDNKNQRSSNNAKITSGVKLFQDYSNSVIKQNQQKQIKQQYQSLDKSLISNDLESLKESVNKLQELGIETKNLTVGNNKANLMQYYCLLLSRQ